METTTCSGCKAFFVNFDGSRHQCKLGYAVKCIGMNKFIATHSYGPVNKCPKPLTDERLAELFSGKDRIAI